MATAESFEVAAGDRGRPPAMTDVARVAGVSHQTVSRVLNDHPSVRPRTRSLVLAAVRELGYRPNSAARTLATGRSRTLGVLTLPGQLYGPVATVDGVEEAARHAGYAVTVVSMQSTEASAVEPALALLMRQGVDGIIAITPLASSGAGLRRAARDMPLVAVEGESDDEHAVVCVDQEQGGRQATEHLLTAGHQSVWHVAGPLDWYEASSRQRAYLAVMREADRTPPPVLPGDWSPRSGFEAGQQLAARSDVTAVFTANDQMALGVLRALRESGKRVPEDVSLVGFDDIPEAGYFWPPLTTVRQDFTEVGRRSLRELISQLDSGLPSSKRILIAPEFVQRHSTAPA